MMEKERIPFGFHNFLRMFVVEAVCARFKES